MEVKKRRASAQAWLTRSVKSLQMLLDADKAAVVELSEAIVEVETKLRSFDEAQHNVEDETSMTDLEAEIEYAFNIREERRYILVAAKERLVKLKSDSQQENANVKDGEAYSSKLRYRDNAQLPKLELPKFSGEFEKWTTFWDKFCAVVDSSNIPDISKFTYLQSVLHGDAAAAIRGLALTAANYECAKSILMERFGRKERIIFAHIQNLLNIHVIPQQSMWKLYDDIQSNVRSLENLGVGGETYGVILTPLILHQLPSAIRLEWARVGEGKENDLTFLLDFLNTEIQRRERSQVFDAPATSSSPKLYPDSRRAGTFVQQETRRQPKNFTGTTSALTAADVGTRQPAHHVCKFCKREKHFPDQCGMIKTLDFDGRRDLLRSMKLCFRCLGHHLAKDCTKNCYSCKGQHHAILCRKRNYQDRPAIIESNGDSTVEHDIDPIHAGVAYSKTGNHTTLMQIVKAGIKNVNVNVMFDSGSDRSYVTYQCAKKLNLNAVDCEDVAFCCFGEKSPKSLKQNREVFELYVPGEGNTKLRLIGMDTICSTMYRAPVPAEILTELSKHTCISFGENFHEGRSVKVDILIGLDYLWSLIRRDIRGSMGVTAQETVFGWMLSGAWQTQRFEQKGANRRVVSLLCQSDISESDVRCLWELDAIGISPMQETTGNNMHYDKFVLDSIGFDQNRYMVKLPWRNEVSKESLLDNRDQALKRLKSLDKRLNRDQGLKQDYDNVFADWQREGIIHEVDVEKDETGGTMYYLPHRPVIRRESITTKVRPVFDASCRGTNGVSLNDCMETGTNMIPDLVKILLRFRQWRYGLTADISKAFLQIKVHPDDQNVHRFLWNVNDQVKTMRFDRVIFGNSCSPFLLNATVRYHLSRFEPTRTVQKLRSSLYVDDWLTGSDSEDEIRHMINEGTSIMMEGSFPLAKWASNSGVARDAISKSFEGLKEVDTLKVLGISWSTENDCFSFCTQNLIQECLFTKRLLLSLSARIFDPLGLLTPFTISVKLLFQEAWREGYMWDDVLPVNFQDPIRKWVRDLLEIEKWKIPRRISTCEWQGSVKRELMVFADASEKAYGCCIYLITDDGISKTSSLVMSKVRIAPLKKVTLPRLELLAALLAARLLKFVKSTLDLEEDIRYTCWSDAQIVLHWIRSDAHRWKQFVCNRVTEIQELTNPSRWKHCPGLENPADLLTRGVTARELMHSELWLNGPSWITLGEEQMFDSQRDLSADFQESELQDQTALTCIEPESSSLMNFERFSDFGKLLRVFTWVLRFVNNVKSRVEKRLSRDLTSEEFSNAKVALLRLIQHQFYQQELDALNQGKVLKKSSPIHQLSPFIGEGGLLRVHGRLEFAPSLLYDEKYPIILPKCHVSFLIVRAQHVSMKHAGVGTLMTSVRNKYWIVALRSLAKRVCSQCIDCQRQAVRPMDQATAPLPEDRIKETPPFSVVGIDHAGPLYCSGTEQKFYILLITCAVTRAVHLELVDSLSLEDFLLAFQRFISRRGFPRIVYSDNAKTFKGAQRYFQSRLSHVDITWKFSAPLAPWWGGWWERLVRTVKSSLRKSLGNKLLTRIQLETVLCEIEACVNSRPLTYVAEEGYPLTPCHFLIGRSTPMNSVGRGEYFSEVRNLALREKCQQQIISQFWETWKKEYIRNLPSMGSKKVRDVEVGSVVLIQDDGKPRLQWPLGVVTKVFKGRDGIIRAVELKTPRGFLCRSVQKLYKLEMFENQGSPTQQISATVTEETEKTNVTKRNTSAEALTKTRSGRTVKPPARLDL